jgi:hypothetical protein
VPGGALLEALRPLQPCNIAAVIHCVLGGGIADP